jgi:glucose/arabinose dehydrogenase
VEGERFMLEAGAELFSEHCTVCHGERMEGAAQGTPLIGAALAGGASVDELVASISNGFPERNMPAWSATMSAEQIKTLALWIAEVREELVYSQFNFMDELTIPEGAIRTQAYDLEIDVLIAGLDPLPYSLAVLPDGHVLVTEKKRGLRLVTPEGDSTLIGGTPAVYDDSQLGYGGVEEGIGWLLDVAPHPRYRENGWIYLAYTDRCGGCNEASRASQRPVSMVKLVRGRIEGGLWADEQVIWQPPLESYSPSSDSVAGGRIAFDPDGYVFLSVGYKSGDGIQDLASPHGKIHRIRDDGRVPADNPFVDVPGAVPSIWSYGHRSPQGLEFDARTRRLWGTEHGPRGGDELNLLLPGRNYGWPLFSNGQNYDGTPVNWDGRHGGVSLEDIEQPVVDLTPSVAVSAFVVYEGDAFAAWRGDHLVGSLKAADLIRLRIKDGQLLEREILIENVARIRDVEIGPTGELYLLLEHASGGQVVRVTPAQSRR